MTRDEQIKHKAEECRQPYRDGGYRLSSRDVRDAFEEGAQWADKTMIEKACQWITEHIDIPYEGEFVDDSPVASDYIEWSEKRLEYAKEITDSFRKAMLEEE